MLDRADKLLVGALQLLSPRCEVFDQVLEALSLLRTFNEAKHGDVLRFVMENYTTEDIIKRCENAVVTTFAKDYQEYMTRKDKKLSS